jgi:NAD-dependent DNA ligase
VSTVKDTEDPVLLRIHADRIKEREIKQLSGICEICLQYGYISEEEADGILLWLDNHRLRLDTWPASILYDRLRMLLVDRTLDSNEQGELLSLIMRIARPRLSDSWIKPSSLPVNDPLPGIIFEGRSFCFTGVFDFGPRAACQAAVIKRGGTVVDNITKKLHYLVIGGVGSEIWKHTSFALKIARAVSYRDSGIPLIIVPESHWEFHIN